MAEGRGLEMGGPISKIGQLCNAAAAKTGLGPSVYRGIIQPAENGNYIVSGAGVEIWWWVWV